MTSGIDEEVFWLEISMNVTQLMKGIYGAEHFGNVETSMAISKNAGIVQQCSEISTRNILLYNVSLVQGR